MSFYQRIVMASLLIRTPDATKATNETATVRHQVGIFLLFRCMYQFKTLTLVFEIQMHSDRFVPRKGRQVWNGVMFITYPQIPDRSHSLQSFKRGLEGQAPDQVGSNGNTRDWLGDPIIASREKENSRAKAPPKLWPVT
jgi:hypothetical protein